MLIIVAHNVFPKDMLMIKQIRNVLLVLQLQDVLHVLIMEHNYLAQLVQIYIIVTLPIILQHVHCAVH